MILLGVVWVVLNISIFQISSSQLTPEHILLKNLIQNYEPSVRPLQNHNSTLNVYFRLKLTQVLELSETDQTLTTNVWIEQEWYDEFLKWDISQYDGLKTLRLSSDKIWVPDTYIYNSATLQDGQGMINGKYVMIHHDGLVKYPVPIKLKSNCELDILYFPFDQQICYLKFASWIYDLSSINFTLFDYDFVQNNKKTSLKNKDFERIRNKISSETGAVDLSGYIDNSGWVLMNITLLRREKNHTHGTFPELIYFIHLKRRYMYYIFNVIIPCALLSILTCSTFWLPCLSGEKVTLGLTCFVAYSVFMLMVAEKVPATSDIVPIISIYLTIVMSFTSMSVIMSVIVTNIHEKSKTCISKDQRLPKIMKLIFITYLARIFRMEKSAKQLLKTVVKLNKKGTAQATATLNSKEPNAKKILTSNQSSDDISSNDNNNNAERCRDKLFKKIAQDLIKAKKQKLKNQLYSSFNASENLNNKYNEHHEVNTCSYHFDKNQNIIHNLDRNQKALITENEEQSPIWLKRMKSENQVSPTDISNDLYFSKLARNEYFLQRKISFSRKESKKTDFSDEVSNDTVLISKSDNNSKNNEKTKKRAKKRITKKYRVRKENLSLYYAYEWILAGLVLDRLFFWIYFTSTILSYMATLYIFPYLVQKDKNDSLIFVP